MRSVLVLNAGSSSLKFAVFPVAGGLADTPSVCGLIEGIGTAPELALKTAAGRSRTALPVAAPEPDGQHREALVHLLGWLGENQPGTRIAAAGHRVVHGGERYGAPVALDDGVLGDLEALVPLAPLHQPHHIRAMRAVAALMPDIGQVACFDTAFHRTQPPVAQTFGLPRAMTAEGIRRYGFHGLSYDNVSRRMKRVLGERAAGRVVICHLGNGSSLCALEEGRSQASTMGFTALDGLLMGTRTGTLDPGVLLYLMQQRGMDLHQVERLIYKESGLLGVSGISQDMRVLLASDAPEAAEALELYCYRIARELGSLVAAVGGLDAVVFTGGIGENAAPVRARVAELSAWAGLRLDADANARHAARIDAPGSAVAVAVVPTDEERLIAMYTAETLGL
ncbi:acetate/propionate family kinase [Thauera sinica]|uniref:Acetate kinase n=1 Tax=Thauera sinica TaxID=2665146 RepID=A0ABW1APS5_9RHOO|nr:acetate/propionate family kinase [Thauera sp. K11]ATE59523.1 acetate kinase [Thauera sp. K11]